MNGPASHDHDRVRWFTPEEANRALPLVRRIVADVVADHGRLQTVLAELDRRPTAELREEAERLAGVLRGYVAELSEIGCLLKGPGEGLVDFRGRLHGRPVFLCWKYGEDEVRWWHELDGGFAGRRPLPAGTLAAPPGTP